MNSTEKFMLSTDDKRYLGVLAYDVLLYADYACSGGLSALTDYQPTKAFAPLQKGLRALITGCNEDETEAIVRGSPGIDEQTDLGRAALTLTLRALTAIRSRVEPGRLLEDIIDLLCADVLDVVEVD